MTDTEVWQSGLAEQHRRNAARLTADDVVVATLPGSGGSLFSTLVLELGFEHLDQYFNVLHENGEVETDEKFLAVRRRLSGYAARDSGTASAPEEQATRFFRSLMPSTVFDLGAVHGAVLLVRDPRDAVHSQYQYQHKASAGLPGATAQRQSFTEFLDTAGFTGLRPVPAWTAMYRSWLDARPALRRSAVVHFADLKTRPVEAVTEMLAALELGAEPERIRLAVERSSFESMRAHEDEVAAELSVKEGSELRMMRRGKVGEWREWWTPDLATRFTDPALLDVAAELGYSLPG